MISYLISSINIRFCSLESICLLIRLMYIDK